MMVVSACWFSILPSMVLTGLTKLEIKPQMSATCPSGDDVIVFYRLRTVYKVIITRMLVKHSTKFGNSSRSEDITRWLLSKTYKYIVCWQVRTSILLIKTKWYFIAFSPVRSHGQKTNKNMSLSFESKIKNFSLKDNWSLQNGVYY